MLQRYALNAIRCEPILSNAFHAFHAIHSIKRFLAYQQWIFCLLWDVVVVWWLFSDVLSLSPPLLIIGIALPSHQMKWVLYFLKLSLKKFLNPKTLLSSVGKEELKLKANQLWMWIMFAIHYNSRIVRILRIVTPLVDNCSQSSQKIRWDLNNLQFKRTAFFASGFQRTVTGYCLLKLGISSIVHPCEARLDLSYKSILLLLESIRFSYINFGIVSENTKICKLFRNFQKF